MNYSTIAAGMTGQQVIDAFNGNITITETEFANVAAAILQRVLSSNIKAIKAEDNKLYYTTDNTNWLPVDNNIWGSITGTLTDQTDLSNALNSKASTSALDLTDQNVSVLSNTVSGLSTTVGTNTTAIANNTTAIGELQTKQAKQVSSDTILSLRIGSNGYLQYSLDDVSWINVQSLAEINWGAIGGEISNQQDLTDALTTKVNVSAFTQHTSDTDNPHNVTKSQVGLGNVDNTSDLDKPISTATQEQFDLVDTAITNLNNNKISITEDIEAIEYMTLSDWNQQKEQGALNDNTIYIVE